MISKNDINNAIDLLHKAMIKKDATRSFILQCRKQIERLQLCRKYIETNPNQQFLLNEVERLETLIFSIETGYNAWKDAHSERATLTEKEARKKYYAERQLDRWKESLWIHQIIVQIKMPDLSGTLTNNSNNTADPSLSKQK